MSAVLDNIINSEYSLIDFEPMIIYTCLFFMTTCSLLIISSIDIYFFNKSLKLPYYGQVSLGMIIFLCIYTLWWGISIIYAFDVTEQDTTLDLLGQWICLNLSSVLLPSTRNSIFVIIFKLSYEKLRITHIYMASLCFISVFIKLVTVIIFNCFNRWRYKSYIWNNCCLMCFFNMPIYIIS